MFLVTELKVESPSLISSMLVTPGFTVNRNSGAMTAYEVYFKLHPTKMFVGIKQRIPSKCGWVWCRNLVSRDCTDPQLKFRKNRNICTSDSPCWNWQFGLLNTLSNSSNNDCCHLFLPSLHYILPILQKHTSHLFWPWTEVLSRPVI